MDNTSFEFQYKKLLKNKKGFTDYEGIKNWKEEKNQKYQLIFNFLQDFEDCSEDFKDKFFNFTFLEFIEDNFNASKNMEGVESKGFYRYSVKYPVIKVDEYIAENKQHNNHLENLKLSVKKCFQDKFSDEEINIFKKNTDNYFSFFNYIGLIKKTIKISDKKYDFLERIENLYCPSNKDLLEKGLHYQDVLECQRQLTLSLENFNGIDVKKYFNSSIKKNYLDSLFASMNEFERKNKYFPIYIYTNLEEEDDEDNCNLSDIITYKQANDYFIKTFKSNLDFKEKVIFYEDMLKIVVSFKNESKKSVLKSIEFEKILNSKLSENESSYFYDIESVWFKFLNRRWKVYENNGDFSQVLRSEKDISFIVFEAAVKILCESFKIDFDMDVSLSDNILKIPKDKYNDKESSEIMESFIDILVLLDKKLINKMILKKEKSILLDISWEDIAPKEASLLNKLKMNSEILTVTAPGKNRLRKF